MADFRLHLDDAGDPPRLLTGPEELTYVKNYEVACHHYHTEQLQQLLRSEVVAANKINVERQRIELRLQVLRRLLADRK